MNKHQTKYGLMMGVATAFYIFFAAFPPIVPAKEIRSVLIVSIDALHPDAIGPKTTETISALMGKGVHTLKGKSTTPPLTLLSHSAMFSGKRPDKGGRKDNSWQPGQQQITTSTIFDDAKLKDFSTGFFYSKEKLGYLISDAVDNYRLDADFSIENTIDFFEKSLSKKFCFLHISGLDRVGPVEGWLSDGYMEELFFIDQSIKLLINRVMSNRDYLIIITSDHAGHGTIHGSEHPDDAKLPLVMISDAVDLSQYQTAKYHVSHLRQMLNTIFDSQ